MFFERPFMIINFSSRHNKHNKHNKIILKKIINRLNKDDEKRCNCRQRVNCPTDGKCLTRSLVYKAEVTSTDDNTTQTYIVVTANDFKTRYRNHLKSLRNEKCKHETGLSKHVWNLKKENRQFSITWAIVKQTPAGRNGKRNCETLFYLSFLFSYYYYHYYYFLFQLVKTKIVIVRGGPIVDIVLVDMKTT